MKQVFFLAGALLLGLSCSKTKTEQAPQVTTIEDAVKSQPMNEYYRLAVRQEKLIRATPNLDLIEFDLKQLSTKEGDAVEHIRSTFAPVLLTEENIKAIFNKIAAKHKVAARDPYPYDTDCKGDWDIQNNRCWSTWMWDQFYGFLAGTLGWGGQVSNMHSFQNCVMAAQEKYIFCSGD